MATPFNYVSGDSQRALEEFSLEFKDTYAAEEPESQWANQLGKYHASKAIKTTFPVPISQAGYNLRSNDDRLRTMYERSLSIKPVEWVDGIAEKARIIESDQFIGWNDEPARIAREARRHPNTLVAQMLEANANLDFYKDEELNTDLAIPLFSDSHPVNIFDSSQGTFDNDHPGTAIDNTLMAAVFNRFRTRKAANGQPMRLVVSHLLVPAAREQEAKDFLESDLMRLALFEAGANTNQLTNNRWKNAVQLVVGDELTDPNLIYPIAMNGPKPWVVQDGGVPEEIVFDKNSEMYKNEGKIGVKYILEMAAVAALPHAIERITLT